MHRIESEKKVVKNDLLFYWHMGQVAGLAQDEGWGG